MKRKLVAVAVENSGRVSPHAGRAKYWQVYLVTNVKHETEYVWAIHLSDESCLHEWHVRDEVGPHPLHRVDVAIAASGGEGVHRRLLENDTELLTTSENDPVEAVKAYANGCLPLADKKHKSCAAV